MEAVSLAIFVCAFFVFSAEGKPQFTKETVRVFAMEGDNVTLEWRYTVGGGQPYSEVIFGSEIQIMQKYSTSLPPWIRSSYRGRLLVNITNDYTSIILLGVKRTDEGSYRLTIVNQDRDRTESRKVDIFVRFEPEVTIDGDQEQSMAKGSNIRLICRYEASPPVSEVQWIKEGTVIAGNTSMLINDSRVKIPSFNASQIQLLITAASLKDGGNYTCKVTNILNSTQDTTMIIIDHEDKPEIATHPQNITTREGQNVTLYCNATGNPVPTISWYKNGCPINNSFTTILSPSHEQLTIRNVNRTDSGDYTCRAKNRVGTDTSNASTINVQFEPEVTIDGDQGKGSNIRLICWYEASPPVSEVQWIKDGTVIARNTSMLINDSRVKIPSFNASQIQLLITAASLKDGGNYTCKVTNILNSTQDTTMIIIEVTPEISIHPRNVTIVRGNNVTFSCSVVGNPAPSVVWTKDGEDVTANGRIKLSSRNDNHSLDIGKVHLLDSGQYRCVANNSKGRSFSSAAKLTVQYVPDPPKDVKVISSGSREVNISWEVGFNGNSAIQNYTVEIREDKQTFRGAMCQGTLLKNNCVIYSTRVSIKELFPWSTYYLRVFTRNMIGSSHYSPVVNVTTDEEVPSSAPPFNVTVLNSTAVYVSWQMLAKQDAKGAILGYYILYKRKSEPKVSWRNRTVDRAETTSLVLASLDEYTSYQFAIQAFNRKGVSGRSEIVERKTDGGGEPAVKDLPERTIFQVGDVVVLTCEATGDPKPSVTWSKNGKTSIPRAQFRNDDHILVIQEVAPSDGGIYECRASNIFGQRRTATAVIIAVPPSIMKDVSPRSVLCAKETSCSLLCHATSDIPFNYSWTRNGQALDGHNIKVMNNSVIITPLDDQDFGDYVCHATNSFGSTTYKITLSESREEENNVQSIFRANDIIWSVIVFPLLVLIGVLIWRLRRAQASNTPATATSRDTIQSVFPLEQHASEPGSYMELRPRPSEGQTRVPPEYQSSQGSNVNAGYYNVVPEEGNKRGSNEEIYDDIMLPDC